MRHMKRLAAAAIATAAMLAGCAAESNPTTEALEDWWDGAGDRVHTQVCALYEEEGSEIIPELDPESKFDREAALEFFASVC